MSEEELKELSKPLPKPTLTEKDYKAVKEMVIKKQEASPPILQRHFGLTYAQACGVIDQLCKDGVIGPADGTKIRKVLIQS